MEIISESKPDVVCLQETTRAWEDYLRRNLGRDYAEMEFRVTPGRAGGGLGVLSKYALKDVAYIPSRIGFFDG